MTIPEKDHKPQRDRFIKAAREIGADDDEATFKAKLAAIARQKVESKQEEQSRGRRDDKENQSDT